MSKKPAATLSANLVAVKGAAVPVTDMPSRSLPAASPVDTSLPPRLAAEPQAGPGDTGGQPLNFRVPDAFRREFKVYAARNGLKLNELLRRSFEAYRRQNGE